MTDRIATALTILTEPFSAGSRVTNCVVHDGLPFDRRPAGCERCATDIQNHLSFAIRVHEFLNSKVDRAKAALEQEPHMPAGNHAHKHQLLPCPFCASDGLTLDNLADPKSGWFVSCNFCEVQQIANYTELQAVERWNMRVTANLPVSERRVG